MQYCRLQHFLEVVGLLPQRSSCSRPKTSVLYGSDTSVAYSRRVLMLWQYQTQETQLSLTNGAMPLCQQLLLKSTWPQNGLWTVLPVELGSRLVVVVVVVVVASQLLSWSRLIRWCVSETVSESQLICIQCTGRANKKNLLLQSLADNSSTVEINFCNILQKYWTFLCMYAKLYFALANKEKKIL